MWYSAGVLVTVIVFVNSQTSTTPKTMDEETQETNAFSNPYMPSSAFKNIFSNSLPTLVMADDGSNTVDENFPSFPSQFTELRRKTQKMTTTTLPIINTTDYIMPTDSNASATVEQRNFINPKRNFQRGVLDLLFPKARVQSFKSVFDGLRRFLSHTFK